jgi:sialate O-acetylesterase
VGAGERRVTASLGGQTRTATADASGAWRVAFPAMNAGGPHELTIATVDARVVIH